MGTCSYCEDDLDSGEIESPYTDTDGALVCDDCYRTHFQDVCPQCDCFVDKGEFDRDRFFMTKAIEGHEPGVYRVLDRPWHMDGMIEGYIIWANVERVSAIPSDVVLDEAYPIEFLCNRCVGELGKGG